MRWDELFDDLEAQLEQGLESDDLELQAENERLRLGRLGLRDRLAALLVDDGTKASALTVRTRGGAVLRLVPTTLGRDWVLGRAADGPASRQLLVPFAAIDALALEPQQLGASLVPPPERPRLTDRLGLPFALRDLCRRRAAVAVTTRADEFHGTIDRVGKDHLDLALHEPGRERRAVAAFRIIPLDALECLRFSL